jgi:uroporphyrinogen decarboxylase
MMIRAENMLSFTATLFIVASTFSAVSSGVSAFVAPRTVFRSDGSVPHSSSNAVTTEASSETVISSEKKDPLLIRAARGETNVERTPVWMMRQAGRHIAEYRELCKQYPTFRMRSEITEVAVEVSLQPWRNYQTDGCILFSDILTPLPGMGCEFIIDEVKGPVMSNPISTYDDLKQVRMKMIY